VVFRLVAVDASAAWAALAARALSARAALQAWLAGKWMAEDAAVIERCADVV
jgi:hypothetical protein